MISLPIRYLNCPLCDSVWMHKSSRYYSFNHYICSANCKLQLIERGNFYKIYKEVSDILEVWWAYDRSAIVYNNLNGSTEYVFENMIPPFNIDKDRLKLIMIMS